MSRYVSLAFVVVLALTVAMAIADGPWGPG
jgi:hypothetical protein